MLGGIEIIKEIGKLQTDYNNLRLDEKLTKKTMWDLVIPFRDKYCLSDKDALAIARNEMHIDEMAKMMEEGFIKKTRELNRFVENFYELETHKLVATINEYATENDLKIISLSTNDNLHGAIVLFEGKKPKYIW